MTPHGNPSTYTNHLCRCGPCRAAWRESVAAARQRRFTTPIPDTVEHGLEATYTNYRCKCWKCLTAHYAYNALRRDKKAGLW